MGIGAIYLKSCLERIHAWWISPFHVDRSKALRHLQRRALEDLQSPCLGWSPRTMKSSASTLIRGRRAPYSTQAEAAAAEEEEEERNCRREYSLFTLAWPDSTLPPPPVPATAEPLLQSAAGHVCGEEPRLLHPRLVPHGFSFSVDHIICSMFSKKPG